MARYAYAPFKLGYCGPRNVSKLNKEVIKRFSGMDGIAYEYIKLIAEKNNLKPLDYDVVEAYWLGNNLLENISTDDLKQMFRKSYSWNTIILRRSELIPQGCKPFHNFHVLYFPSGVTGRVNINKKFCMILPAKVINEGLVELLDGEVRKINVNFEKVKKGDIVSVHYNTIVQKLDSEMLQNLNNYTTLHQDLLGMNNIQ